MAPDIIRVQEVSYSIGEAEIIRNVSFAARANRFVSIIGPSGCGKSTLLRIMAGLERPTSGGVTYRGRRITEPTRDISFVFQDFGLLPWLTNVENVKIGLSASGAPETDREKRAVALLESFGLAGFEHAYPNVLSGGMKQRVGLARALAGTPEVVLMDEPFSSLDELTAQTLRSDVVQMLRGRRIRVNSVIMVTHNVNEAVELSDDIVILTNKPTEVREIMTVGLPYPRERRSKGYLDRVDYLYKRLMP